MVQLTESIVVFCIFTPRIPFDCTAENAGIDVCTTFQVFNRKKGERNRYTEIGTYKANGSHKSRHEHAHAFRII
jgi:hypothetical protein